MASVTALRDLIRNPGAAELELVARYAMLPEDARRMRAFEAFAASGLPHRRMEAWKWSDFKRALDALESPKSAAATDPLMREEALTFKFTPTGFDDPKPLPEGIRMLAMPDVLALGGAEDMPMGALAAALAGRKSNPGTLMFEISDANTPPIHLQFAGHGEGNFNRVAFVIRPGAELCLSESHLGGAGLSSALIEFDVHKGASVNRTVFQRGGKDETQAVTAACHLQAEARYTQSVLAFGAQLARIETRLIHQESSAQATLNAAYLSGDGYHCDMTTFVRHGAPGCTTQQLTRGAVMAGGTGVFQGKFLVPRIAGQHTDADMQHNAILLEEGATVFAKPELEIYADDVECTHGNTCGELDETALFYMRQRGIPEAQARALLIRSFMAEAVADAGALEETLLSEIEAWLAK